MPADRQHTHRDTDRHDDHQHSGVPTEDLVQARGRRAVAQHTEHQRAQHRHDGDSRTEQHQAHAEQPITLVHLVPLHDSSLHPTPPDSQGRTPVSSSYRGLDQVTDVSRRRRTPFAGHDSQIEPGTEASNAARSRARNISRPKPE
jgi:hypothetical protein